MGMVRSVAGLESRTAAGYLLLFLTAYGFCFCGCCFASPFFLGSGFLS